MKGSFSPKNPHMYKAIMLELKCNASEVVVHNSFKRHSPWCSHVFLKKSTYVQTCVRIEFHTWNKSWVVMLSIHWSFAYWLHAHNLFSYSWLKELVTSESLKDEGMVVKKAIMAGKIPMRTLSLLSSIRFLRFFTKSFRSSSITST
jgi:hypothetical protein